MNKIEQIKAEIERRVEILTNVYTTQIERKDEQMMNYYHGKVVALEELLAFVNSLPDEPSENIGHLNSEDLEKAAEEFAEREYMYGSVDKDALEKGFYWGAQWQKEQMMKNIERMPDRWTMQYIKDDEED